MPACADPNRTIDFSLAADAKDPADTRAVFKLRFITEQEAYEVRHLILDASKMGGDKEGEKAARELLDKAIAIGLVDVVKVKFRGGDVKKEAKPSGYLTTDELWELANAIVNEPRLSESDRKKSASSVASDTAHTAPIAAAENA